MVNWWSAPVAVGEYAYFEVADNGEGSKSDPDKFSDLFAGFDYPWFNLEILCDNYLTINMNDIYNGNIQVTNNEMD